MMTLINTGGKFKVVGMLGMGIQSVKAGYVIYIDLDPLKPNSWGAGRPGGADYSDQKQDPSKKTAATIY
jgi:hypothetical protein